MTPQTVKLKGPALKPIPLAGDTRKNEFMIKGMMAINANKGWIDSGMLFRECDYF